MVQIRVDGTRKDPLTVVNLPPTRTWPLSTDRDVEAPRSSLDRHVQRVGSRSFWAISLITYGLLMVLCVGCSWMSSSAVEPMVNWPYNASATFLNTTPEVFIYANNSLGTFMSPLLPHNLVSPVPSWVAILIQGSSIQFMIVLIFLYEAVAAIARVHVYKRRTTITHNAQRFIDMALALLGGFNFIIAFMSIICVICAVLFLQVDSSTGYETTQLFMSSISNEDVPLIQDQFYCNLAGRNETLNMTVTTTTTADYDYYGGFEVYTPIDCAAVLYGNVEYVVKLKMLLIIFTSLVSLILVPIIAKGDHRLAVEMRTNPIYKIEE